MLFLPELYGGMLELGVGLFSCSLGLYGSKRFTGFRTWRIFSFLLRAEHFFGASSGGRFKTGAPRKDHAEK